MIDSNTPNIWEIRSELGVVKAKAVVVTALIHLARLFSVERNLEKVQIAEIAEDVVNDYGYLKVEELKYLLKRAARNEKIFGRLDYNVVMNWIKEYAEERTGLCEGLSRQEETRELNESHTTVDSMTWTQYVNYLWSLASYADPDAIERIYQIQEGMPTNIRILSKEERHQKEIEFKKYYYNEYLKLK